MFRRQAVRFSLCFSLATFLVASEAAAFYPDSIPNFEKNECLTCHTHVNGGDACGSPPCLNPFGVQFNNNGRVWNATLAGQNADGDAFTNGRELLDPLGRWDVGDVDPGNSTYVTAPGTSNAAMAECAIVSVSVDAVSSTYSNCSANATCAENNGLPGYTCTCKAGYEGNGVSCTDQNECAMPVGRCGQGSCQNLPGSFTCNCNTGYYFNGNTCSQDACVRNVDDCNSANATCTPSVSNPVNEWTCGCSPGYTGRYLTSVCTLWFSQICLNWVYSDWTCTNVDECTTGAARCPSTSACADTPGSFTCMACGANAHVVGPINAESCVCNPSYHGDPYSGCEDDDECASSKLNDCGENAICTNTPGSYTCACAPGFTGNGRTCTDFDECVSTKLNDCSENARCDNTPGSYTCTCNDHFSGNGLVCADINECMNGTSGCGTNEDCQNLFGAPNTCACSPGYARNEGGVCASSCGNGLRALRERCDDGNTTSGDGCSATCTVEPGYACYEPSGGASTCTPTCGDALIDPPAEDCDEGTSNSDTAIDGCRTSCRRAYCGDGVIDTDETCDTGMDVSDTAQDACRTTCVPAFCGDGVADTGERCDPGGGNALDPSECQRKTCGTVNADGGIDPPRSEGGCAVEVAGDGSGTFVAGLGMLLLVLARRRRSLR